MEKMLEIDADKRINAAQTLSHPYLEEVKFKMFEICLIIISNIQYADPSDEPTAPFYDQTFEDYDLTVDVWKEKVWNTIKMFREEMFGERFVNQSLNFVTYLQGC